MADTPTPPELGLVEQLEHRIAHWEEVERHMGHRSDGCRCPVAQHLTLDRALLAELGGEPTVLCPQCGGHSGEEGYASCELCDDLGVVGAPLPEERATTLDREDLLAALTEFADRPLTDAHAVVDLGRIQPEPFKSQMIGTARALIDVRRLVLRAADHLEATHG